MIILFETAAELAVKEKLERIMEWFFTLDEIHYKYPEDIAIATIVWGLGDIEENLSSSDLKLWRKLSQKEKLEVAKSLRSSVEVHTSINEMIHDLAPALINNVRLKSLGKEV